MKKIKRYLIERIYHYSTYLTSWSWQKLYGKRNHNENRKHFANSILSFDKKDDIVKQIIKSKRGKK
jgi:hypothetical protein|tara:strand:- start:25 stop:222 length:198 start_codon:yes stop_codon:yes gene_type:complete